MGTLKILFPQINRLCSFSKISIILLVLTNLSLIDLNEAHCVREFYSKGSFESPSRNYRYNNQDYHLQQNQTNSNATNETSKPKLVKPIHCLYKFVGQEDERVMLNFTSFRMRGDEPECNREYVDMFVTFKSNDDIDTLIGKEPPTGRFCSHMIPRRLISLHNMIVLIIHSELSQPVNAARQQVSLFEGKFEFIQTKPYDQIGPPLRGTLCNHIIDSQEHREGEFQSITYPGVYVKGLACSYKFLGSPGQRVRLEFFDLDLYSGGPHCPLDSVKIYDGKEESAQLINTICGSHRSLIVFSSHENLLITFNTMVREFEIQNRGFSANFEFSDKFVQLDFIEGPNAKHIRGSECDQRVVSSRQSTGLVRAPTSKHHTNAICRYIFEGLQSNFEYERVLLKFKNFNLKSSNAPANNNPGITTTPNYINNSNNSNNNNTSDVCIDNYVRLYTAEQKLDPNDYDYAFCGTDLPQPVESDAATLLMEYNSGSLDGLFEAEYNFVVDYRIPGFQNGSGCNYIYRSDLIKSGSFNSPRYPSWYMNDLNCTYTFITKPNEALLIQFITFKTANSSNLEFTDKVLGYNEVCQGHDRAEIYELQPIDHLSMSSSTSLTTLQYTATAPNNNYNNNNLDDLSVAGKHQVGDIHSLIGTFCGATTPGPILSYKPMRINFITNSERVHYGFYAHYNFHLISELKTNEFVTNCGEQIITNQRLKSGSFQSPKTYQPEIYEKRNHICFWNITARPGYKIGLNFTNFMLEGNRSARGCITTSVRITTGRSVPPVEICGKWLGPSANSTPSLHQFVSETETLSVSFISTKLASGSVGFSATWLELRKAS